MKQVDELMAKFLRFLRLPKMQLASFLLIMAGAAILFGHQPRALLSITVAIMATVIADLIFIKLRGIEPFFLSAAVVSGLIIGLLSFPGLTWYVPAMAGVLAMVSKNFIKANNRHIFNPAAFGLFATGLIFRESVSWWGVIFSRFELNLFPILMFVILLSPLYISGFRLKRWGTIFGFLITFFLFQFLSGNFNLTIISPLLIFFSSVMLPEPMTSPNNPRLQIIFGICVVLLAFLLNSVNQVFLPNRLIAGLLLGNLIFYKLKQKFP